MPSCGKDFDWFTNKITIGDTKDMDVVVYDSTFLSYSNPTQDEPVTINWVTCRNYVDLDYDGIGDIIFDLVEEISGYLKVLQTTIICQFTNALHQVFI